MPLIVAPNQPGAAQCRRRPKESAGPERRLLVGGDLATDRGSDSSRLIRGHWGNEAVTTPRLRRIGRRELIAALERSRDPLVDELVEVLDASPEAESYASASQPASSLTRTLRTKYAIAARAGIPIVGGQEVIVSLARLGSELVRGVAVDSGQDTYTLLLRDNDGSVLGIARVSRRR